MDTRDGYFFFTATAGPEVRKEVAAGVAAGPLCSMIIKLEHLKTDKGPFWEDEIRNIYAKARYEGIDVGAMRMVIALRKKERVREEEEILGLYLAAIGMDHT